MNHPYGCLCSDHDSPVRQPTRDPRVPSQYFSGSQPSPGPCYQCEIRDGGKAIQQIVYCPLHAQAPAMREALAAIVHDGRIIQAVDVMAPQAVALLDEARAIVRAIEGT